MLRRKAGACFICCLFVTKPRWFEYNFSHPTHLSTLRTPIEINELFEHTFDWNSHLLNLKPSIKIWSWSSKISFVNFSCWVRPSVPIACEAARNSLAFTYNQSNGELAVVSPGHIPKAKLRYDGRPPTTSTFTDDCSSPVKPLITTCCCMKSCSVYWTSLSLYCLNPNLVP